MIKFYKKRTSLSFRYISQFVLILLMMTSCDDKETLPTFIQINELQLQTDISQGSDNHNINNVWLFVDGQSLGIYEIPVTIPILIEQEASVSIIAGIENNGISSTHIIYPFWASNEFQLAPNTTTTTILPEFAYINNMFFDFINDFEQGNNFVDLGGRAALQLTSNSSQVFEGNRSGRITLGGEATNFNIITGDSYELPGNKRAVFLEMTYKCSLAFQVIVRGTKEGSSSEVSNLTALIVNAKDNWNTIYVDLTDEASILNDGGYIKQQIIFQSALPSGESQATFFWDNLKLLHQL